MAVKNVMISPITTRNRDHNEQQLEADRDLPQGRYRDQRYNEAMATFYRPNGGGREKKRRSGR